MSVLDTEEQEIALLIVIHHDDEAGHWACSAPDLDGIEGYGGSPMAALKAWQQLTACSAVEAAEG